MTGTAADGAATGGVRSSDGPGEAAPRLGVLQLIRSDRRVNRNARIRMVLLTFRVAHAARRAGAAGVPVRALHRAVSEWLLGMELPASVQAGPALKIEHGYGLVVHPRTVLGANVVLKHGVTIGVNGKAGPPIIGDGVVFGPGSQVLGAVTVGARSRIGAQALVLRDVPADSAALGVPARSRPLSARD